MPEIPAAFCVRPADESDVPAMLGLARRLAQSEGATGFVATEDAWRRDGFGPARRFAAVVAEADGQSIGMITVTEFYSTGLARSALFIIDFFVDEEWRGKGVGKALLAQVAALAVVAGAPAVQIGVQGTNPARRLYEKVGFVPLRDFAILALMGPQVRALAEPALAGQWHRNDATS